MSSPISEIESIDKIKQEREYLIHFVLQLIYADKSTRNQLLNNLKPEAAKRTAGRPRKRSTESDAEYLKAVDFIKAEASKIAERKLSDDSVLILPQIYILQETNKRLGHINDQDYKAKRKTQKNILSEARKSQKLSK